MDLSNAKSYNRPSEFLNGIGPSGPSNLTNISDIVVTSARFVPTHIMNQGILYNPELRL